MANWVSKRIPANRWIVFRVETDSTKKLFFASNPLRTREFWSGWSSSAWKKHPRTYEACLILNRTGARMASLRTWYEGFWGHMKGIWVLFQMRYGSLICPKEWLSDRPKWRGMLADPGAFQSHAESGLFLLSLICTRLSEKFKIFVPIDSSRSPLSNEIW